MTTTALAPNPTEQAKNSIDQVLVNALAREKNTVSRITKLLTTTKNADGTTVAQADIITAGGDRFQQLTQYVAALKTTVNILAPGTY